jgi:hypothetical protein
MTENQTHDRTTRRRRVIAVLASGALAIGGLAFFGIQSAQAGPYANCDPAKYIGANSWGNGGTATVRCHAASRAAVRIKLTCFVAMVPSAYKYTAWSGIAAGTSKLLTYTSNGWCESFGQTWRADGQVQ